MSKRSKYRTDEKHAIVVEYLEGPLSEKKISKAYQISTATLKKWCYKYKRYGIEGLQESHTCKKYSRELKELAVRDYLTGKYSKAEIARKYEISDSSVLRFWIKKYNSHKELKDTRKGMSAIMTKGRNTTWKERIEIVDFCIANNRNYQNTSEEYKVSYQQVRTWVKKYENGGEDALKDRRGRNKPEEELTPEEIIELKLKKLEAENKRLMAENLLLKKLEDMERGGIK